MPKGGGGTTSTQTISPPTEVKPYILGDPSKNIRGILPEAERLYRSDMPSYFPGSTVAGFNPTQVQAQQQTLNAANANLQPNVLAGAAGGQLERTIAGDYVNQGNPYLDAVSQSVMSRILPQVQGQAELAGRFGSGAEAQALVSRGTDALAPYAFNQYQQERQNQLGAVNAVNPYLSGQQALQYRNIGEIAGVGAQEQGMSQAEISAAIARHNFGENVQQNKLNQYAATVQGIPGSTSSTSTPDPGFGPQQWAGTALGLGGLGTSIAGLWDGGGGGAAGAGK